MANSILKVDQVNANSAAFLTLGTPLTSYQMNPATLLSQPPSGEIEFDGNVFYQTANAIGNRAVNQMSLFTLQSPDLAATNSFAAQQIFTTGRSRISLPGLTTYLMEGFIQVTGMSALARTLGLSFNNGSSTFSAFTVDITCETGAASSLATVFNAITYSTTNPGPVSIATSVSTAAATVRFRGVFTTATAGIFYPAFIFDTASVNAPGASAFFKSGNFLTLTPLGSNTSFSSGNWS